MIGAQFSRAWRGICLIPLILLLALFVQKVQTLPVGESLDLAELGEPLPTIRRPVWAADSFLGRPPSFFEDPFKQFASIQASIEQAMQRMNQMTQDMFAHMNSGALSSSSSSSSASGAAMSSSSVRQVRLLGENETEVTLNLEGFLDSEVNATLNARGDAFEVRAVHSEDTNTTSIRRSIVQIFELPQNVDLPAIRWRFEDGKFKAQFPRKQQDSAQSTQPSVSATPEAEDGSAASAAPSKPRSNDTPKQASEFRMK